jgi:hypothetical protein
MNTLTGVSLKGPPLPLKGGGPAGRDPHLRDWLGSCRERGVGLGVSDGDRVVPTGPATEHDEAMAHRHAHALAVAAAGSHPAWWNRVLGRGTCSAADLPVVVDPTTVDGLAFRCATCGHPADELDPDLLGWCGEHLEREVAR